MSKSLVDMVNRFWGIGKCTYMLEYILLSFNGDIDVFLYSRSSVEIFMYVHMLVNS